MNRSRHSASVAVAAALLMTTSGYAQAPAVVVAAGSTTPSGPALGVPAPATNSSRPERKMVSATAVNVSPQRRSSLPPSRPKKSTDFDDAFAGVKLTDDQKAQIDQIHQEMKTRMDTVTHDGGSAEWQKSAMIEGLQRIERRQLFQILTPDQQAEVRKKVLTARAAEQKERQDRKQKQMDLMQK